MGACSGVVLSRAMVRDLYEGSRAAQMLSTLITVMAVAPLLGPIVGGQVLAIAGWRAIFGLLVVLGLATLAALFTIPETLPIEMRRKDSLLSSLRGYGRLFMDRRLIGSASIGGFFFAGVYAYIAGTPFAFIEYYHVPPQLYGVLFALGIVGIMLANLANARLVNRFGSLRLVQFGAIGAPPPAASLVQPSPCSQGATEQYQFAKRTFAACLSIESAMWECPSALGCIGPPRAR
nr:MFS transporter [Rhizobium ruizarguesonis]